MMKRASGKSIIPGRWSKIVIAYLFLIPALTGLVMFRIYPIISTLVGSLYRVDYKQGGISVFAGLQNYLSLFTDPNFWESLKVTLVFNLFINPIQIALALIVALLVHKNTKINRIFRTAYLLPLGVSIVVASSIWVLLLNPNDGLVNSTIQLAGIPKQPFLTSTTQALWCVILVASWCGISYWMLFFMAGLQEIPVTLYEAAVIDGANAWQSFWKITLPLLKRVLLFVTVADTSANFLLFAPIYVLTNGGPQMSTNTLMFETYSSAFVYSDIPRALTLSSILLIVLLACILTEFKFFQEK